MLHLSSSCISTSCLLLFVLPLPGHDDRGMHNEMPAPRCSCLQSNQLCADGNVCRHMRSSAWWLAWNLAGKLQGKGLLWP